MRSNRLASHPLTRGLRRPCDRQAGSQHPRSCPSGMHGPGPGDAARISECLAGRGLRARSSSEGPQCGPQWQREKRLWSPSATSRQVLPVRRGPLRRTGSRSRTPAAALSGRPSTRSSLGTLRRCFASGASENSPSRATWKTNFVAPSAAAFSASRLRGRGESARHPNSLCVTATVATRIPIARA